MEQELSGISEQTLQSDKLRELEEENKILRLYLGKLLSSLNCIARTAYFEGAQNTEEAIYCISHLIQYNIMQRDRLHSVAREIANIEQYLYIQKLRMGKYLTWEIFIDERAAAYRIPNLTLYPIVENAVVHGISGKPEGGMLRISSQWKEDTLLLVVEDNGSGFSHQALRRLSNSREGRQADTGSLWTIQERLKRYYGQASGLELVSATSGNGAAVTVTIPVEERRDG